MDLGDSEVGGQEEPELSAPLFLQPALQPLVHARGQGQPNGYPAQGWSSPSRLPAMQSALADLKSVCAGYWGTGKTLQAFFRYLQLAGVDPLYHYREKFWQAYFQTGYIIRTWLVLASSAEEFFQREFKLQHYQYGRLLESRGGGGDPSHAILILRLERLVVAEWSHGRGSFYWLQNHLHLPSLFHSEYQASELSRYAAYAQKHYFSAKGLWQKDASAWMSAKAHIPACLL